MGFKLGLAAGLTAGLVAGVAASVKQGQGRVTAETSPPIPTIYSTEPGSQAGVDEIPTVWQSTAETSPPTETGGHAAAPRSPEDDA